jgi:hypothetical protein
MICKGGWPNHLYFSVATNQWFVEVIFKQPLRIELIGQLETGAASGN